MEHAAGVHVVGGLEQVGAVLRELVDGEASDVADARAQGRAAGVLELDAAPAVDVERLPERPDDPRAVEGLQRLPLVLEAGRLRCIMGDLEDRDCLTGERGIGIRVRHEQGHAGRAAAEPGFDDEVVGEDVERVCLERVDDDHGLRIGLPLLDGGVEVVQEVARAGGALQPGIGVGRAHDEAAEPIGHPVDLDAGIQPCAPADALLKLGYRARRRRRGQEQVAERAEAIHVQRDAVGVVHPGLRREVDPRVLVGQGDEVACALQHGRLPCSGRVLDVGTLPAGLPVANGHEQRPARLVDDIDLTRGQGPVGHPAVMGVLHDLPEPADHLEPALGHHGLVVGR